MTQGLVRDRDVTWFPELSDKGKQLSQLLGTILHIQLHRAQYQDPFVLGYEELWWGRSSTSANGSEHHKPLQGKPIGYILNILFNL